MTSKIKQLFTQLISSEEYLKPLSFLGTIELRPLLGVCTLKKEIGKVSMTMVPAQVFSMLFSLNNQLQHGSLVTYLKEDEVNPYLTLEYRLDFRKSLSTQLILEVKEELVRIEDVFKEAKYAEALLITSQKMFNGVTKGKSTPEVANSPGFPLSSLEDIYSKDTEGRDNEGQSK